MSEYRRVAALERRLGYHVRWAQDARIAAQHMLSNDEQRQRVGRSWWEAHFAQPEVILSTPTPPTETT